jgi:hypothetical protein
LLTENFALIATATHASTTWNMKRIGPEPSEHVLKETLPLSSPKLERHKWVTSGATIKAAIVKDRDV